MQQIYKRTPMPKYDCNKNTTLARQLLQRAHLCTQQGFPSQSAILIKLQSNFVEITSWYGCSPINLLHVFRTPFPKNIPGQLLLEKHGQPSENLLKEKLLKELLANQKRSKKKKLQKNRENKRDIERKQRQERRN